MDISLRSVHPWAGHPAPKKTLRMAVLHYYSQVFCKLPARCADVVSLWGNDYSRAFSWNEHDIAFITWHLGYSLFIEFDHKDKKEKEAYQLSYPPSRPFRIS
ncbi:hypothetical protein F2Q68_00040384 [Brassica cretica]|uniref:Uncharacterized protein n=1 Tax=Brassica cretica TaxID=69181 RepID=A0A8S9MIX7_BRACR|nr:hypothetical protein F2Q68_00040384 [Brassica cretica]